MKKYFVYQLKKSILPFALLALACAIIYVLPVAVRDYGGWNSHPDYSYVNLHTENAIIALGIMSVASPTFFFAYKMNKRSVDMYYSLPLSRTKIAAVHFICGFICIFAAFTVGYIAGVVTVIEKVRRLYLLNYLWIYLASFVPSLTLYTLSGFLYTRANTVVDGIIFIVLGLFALSVTYAIIHSVVVAAAGNGKVPSADGFLPWKALESVIDGLAPRIYGDRTTGWDLTRPQGTYGYAAYMYDVCGVVGTVTFTLLAVGAAFGLFFTEKNCKAENCGQISESIFGYKVCIPLYLFSLCMVCGDDVIMLSLVTFAAAALTLIYRRTIKIGKKQAVLFAIYLAVSIVCGILVNLSHWI